MKLCKDKHNFVLMATSISGKKYWMCLKCKYKTDWRPFDKKLKD